MEAQIGECLFNIRDRGFAHSLSQLAFRCIDPVRFSAGLDDFLIRPCVMEYFMVPMDCVAKRIGVKTLAVLFIVSNGQRFGRFEICQLVI